jgi:signal transduction histidine kinase
VREPLARAIEVSDRIAGGDLSARMGASGPDALSHLGAAMDGMAVRLQQEDHDRRRFLADVAHEIATPVGTIVGYAEAIADGTAAHGAERERAGRAIADAGERVARLLGALRELTTLDLYGEVHAVPVELAGLVDDVVERQRPAAADRQVELTADVPQANLVSDRRLLETILENLLTNAVRYTPPGGRVQVGARAAGDAVEVWVSDTGPGLDADQQRLVFDDLYRTDEARQVSTGGAGLGLSIARRAAHALAGSISLESSPGEGSTFTVRVPRAAAQPAGTR